MGVSVFKYIITFMYEMVKKISEKYFLKSPCELFIPKNDPRYSMG